MTSSLAFTELAQVAGPGPDAGGRLQREPGVRGRGARPAGDGRRVETPVARRRRQARRGGSAVHRRHAQVPR